MYSRLCRIKPKKLAIILGIGSAIVMKNSLVNDCHHLNKHSNEELEKLKNEALNKYRKSINEISSQEFFEDDLKNLKIDVENSIRRYERETSDNYSADDIKSAIIAEEYYYFNKIINNPINLNATSIVSCRTLNDENEILKATIKLKEAQLNEQSEIILFHHVLYTGWSFGIGVVIGAIIF